MQSVPPPPSAQEGVQSDSGKETEVSSHVLEGSEECSLPDFRESTTLSEEDEDDDASASSDADDDRVSATSASSLTSEDDWECPATSPWMRFSYFASTREPWNTTLWHRFPTPPLIGFSWSALSRFSDHLRCSVIYASVLLRGYRRKCVRAVNASLAARTFKLSCPKRSLHPTATAPPQAL